MHTIKTPNVIQTKGAAEVQKVINYPRTSTGLVDTDAYKGLYGTIVVKDISVNVEIFDARIRYGHLDLCVKPVSGTGTVWVERKNINIDFDPGLSRTENIKVEKNDASPPVMSNHLSESIKELVEKILLNGQKITLPTP